MSGYGDEADFGHQVWMVGSEIADLVKMAAAHPDLARKNAEEILRHADMLSELAAKLETARAA